MPQDNLAARFWSKVNKDGPTQPHMDTPCWLWTGAISTHGYGRIVAGGRVENAQRVAYALCVSPPGSMWVLHHCDVRHCVRPDHLWLGDNAANVADMMAKGRQVARRGLRHGAHTKPERVSRGDHHRTLLHAAATRRGRIYALVVLTDADIADIHRRHQDGETQVRLAAAIGVNRRRIIRILKGQSR